MDLDDGLPVTDSYQAAQWATAVMMANMMMNASGQPPTAQPSLFVAIASERLFIMKQLGIEPSEKLKGLYNRYIYIYIYASKINFNQKWIESH